MHEYLKRFGDPDAAGRIIDVYLPGLRSLVDRNADLMPAAISLLEQTGVNGSNDINDLDICLYRFFHQDPKPAKCAGQHDPKCTNQPFELGVRVLEEKEIYQP